MLCSAKRRPASPSGAHSLPLLFPTRGLLFPAFSPLPPCLPRSLETACKYACRCLWVPGPTLYFQTVLSPSKTKHLRSDSLVSRCVAFAQHVLERSPLVASITVAPRLLRVCLFFQNSQITRSHDWVIQVIKGRFIGARNKVSLHLAS